MQVGDVSESSAQPRHHQGAHLKTQARHQQAVHRCHGCQTHDLHGPHRDLCIFEHCCRIALCLSILALGAVHAPLVHGASLCLSANDL